MNLIYMEWKTYIAKRIYENMKKKNIDTKSL